MEKQGVGSADDRLVTGYGITSIRNRLEQICGRVEIHSKPGEGTQVALFIPLPDLEIKTSQS